MTTAPPAAPASGAARTAARRPALLLLPALAALLVFFGVPLAGIVWRALTDPQPGLANFTWFFTHPANLDALGRTFTTAAWTTLAALALGYPYAYAMTRAGARGRALLTLLVLVPFWTSLMVRTFAWMILMQDSGLINQALGAVGLGPLHLIRTPTGVVVAMVQMLLPFMVLPLYAVMAGVDRRLLSAARSLGARPAAAFLQVYVPLSLPGAAAGALTVFINALGFYVTPALLGSPEDSLLSQEIFTQVNGLLEWGRGGAMGVVLLAMTLGLLSLGALALHLSGNRRRP
ncbi:ABC transporter permease [Nocardiopsis composta]|uniref:Putative spermidine/putrescine transport system permease protein n=1 Tax=Nocardiopsis composta TaxID=157465 RepID=A0A7W8VCA7_9ACTN|nr:ABC transporter permease [Nocardiopsis composta]MBB5430674.1 putative spermidine/putrescine transport system permease protein [Nocardiopsis composta]